MKRVVLFTMANCPHCQTAKRYLQEQGISFRECNVKTPRGGKELASLGYKAVPVLKIGDQIMNGFSVRKFKQLYGK